jgi:hypothetical protein
MEKSLRGVKDSESQKLLDKDPLLKISGIRTLYGINTCRRRGKEEKERVKGRQK